MTLLGYRLDGKPFHPIGFVHLTLFWRAEADSLPDREVAARLRAIDGEVVAQVQNRPADGGYPTTAWRKGEVVRDLYSFWLDENFPPGHYTLEVSVRRGDTGEPVLDDADREWVPLLEIAVQSEG